MTINEAIGIKSVSEVSHEEKYSRLIDVVGGLDAVIPCIPFSLTSIREALEHHDEHLNTLPLRTWDSSANNYVKDLMYRKARITCSSLSERVCLLKEAARQWAERETKSEEETNNEQVHRP